jgi:hypothetical protein
MDHEKGASIAEIFKIIAHVSFLTGELNNSSESLLLKWIDFYSWQQGWFEKYYLFCVLVYYKLYCFHNYDHPCSFEVIYEAISIKEAVLFPSSY